MYSPGPSLSSCCSSVWLSYHLPSDLLSVPSAHTGAWMWPMRMKHSFSRLTPLTWPLIPLLETLVQSMVKNLEKQLETPAKKPAGGVSVFLRPNIALQMSSVPGRKPQLSEDESDLEISSLEDLSKDLDQKEKPKPLSCSKLPEV
ncbi:zinc finger protein DZIP1L-like [Nannospalax galili]|uniref:zinc finger protein DZIP1L-like n=1 Tax=Nannospalax galili TaxID=1026970 RepID=UPI00111BF667|nr:zinc finger protein DZIP1L-like [Nannospalax galili]